MLLERGEMLVVTALFMGCHDDEARRRVPSSGGLAPIADGVRLDGAPGEFAGLAVAAANGNAYVLGTESLGVVCNPYVAGHLSESTCASRSRDGTAFVGVSVGPDFTGDSRGEVLSDVGSGMVGLLDGHVLEGEPILLLEPPSADAIRQPATIVGATDDGVILLAEDGDQAADGGGAYVIDAAVRGTVELEDARAHVRGASEQAECIYQVAPAGDNDGDGLEDMVIACSGGATAWVFLSPVDADVSLGDGDVTIAPFGAVTPGSSGETLDQDSVGSMGDNDGDGLDDIFYAPIFGPEPTIFIYAGGASGVLDDTGAVATLHAAGAPLAFEPVVPAGDVDCDGRPDIMAADAMFGVDHASTVYVMRGPFEGVTEPLDPAWAWTSPEPGDWFGYSIASGDLDGSGAPDTLIGAPLSTAGGNDAGSVYILLDPGLG